ncbi:unnamed protein product [Didymodactylos carnosus]|uniref:G-protein coupled receptors family 1 profile domain-containing protein n=1 Tax=Didymodactylos carnosus TaxID=1234261 RepID=A0A813RW13_9BILA|nr:unnamed protein product [Didymodactylos carnosus]CAF1116741.1 unnamed protein product [Didymodactylos carnosus]CAF3569673.1 unnamed protein product [Didymodactylos carnosus]CAF3887538.1 unnamed protein product [Didymodactylos carnosus]
MDSSSLVISDSNHSGDDSNLTNDTPTLHARIGFACAWVMIAVAGVIGNGLVIFVAIRFQKLNNVTNCFIVNLAITDIVFLAFCMPLLVVQYTLDQWFFSEILCKLLNFISFVSVLVTVLTLVVMTIDRYIYVVRPFENLTWRRPSTVFGLSFFIWIISCGFASPFYQHYGISEKHDDSKWQCVLLSPENLQKKFRIYTVTLYYFIPLTIIIACYGKLLFYVFKKENKLKPKTKDNVARWSKKRRAVTKMVAIVTVVFSVCWLPITLLIIYPWEQKHKTVFLYYFKVIANSLSYLNSCCNPIIYAFLNRSFRQNCGSLLSRPSCSLLCGEEHFHHSTNKSFINHPPPDTYESNNDNNNHQKKIKFLISPRIANNDFSDAENDNEVSVGKSRRTRKKSHELITYGSHLTEPLSTQIGTEPVSV